MLLLGDKGEMIMTDLSISTWSTSSAPSRGLWIGSGPQDRSHKAGKKGKTLHETIRRHLVMAERMLQTLTRGEREVLLELMEC
ncbi:MAG: hypothetical protein HY820_26215 [Acidobacteria bacterium]|nr:hypothetical protein [Acidobacteriota bacterium]